ncbi:MAG: DUF2791 family P-loop domain-containing protein [Euryarchaeota archaeon]|nr:DUF2791 family P-loop domain-containing protein [Euryarchaeota archaeon]
MEISRDSPPASGRALQPPLVGRERETRDLRAALERAAGGRGESWALTGPGGMGKTRLLRWLEEEARGRGFEVRAGGCLKESLAPFFPFEQVFRRGSVPPNVPRGEDAPTDPALPTMRIVEEGRPRRFWNQVEEAARGSSLLLVTREKPSSLRETRPALKDGATLLWMTRLEGSDHVAPGAIDALGERLEAHLRGGPGRVVAVEGLEYLVSQNAFPPVLRLLQFLHDVASETDGHLLTTLNPSALEPREVSLLESDAEVEREDPKAAADKGASPSSGPETPAATLMRYLSMLEEAAGRAPQLLILDDLQWADPQSVSAFQFLARNQSGLPVLLVVAFREEESPERAVAFTGLEEARDALSREGLLQVLGLKGLGAEDVLRLAALAVDAPSVEVAERSAVDRLVHRTEGNPYFLREILAQLIEEGRLRRTSRGAVLDLPPSDAAESLPASVRRLVARRLEALPPEERRVLECAAVSGSEFELSPVSEVLGTPAREVLDRLENLYRRRRLVEPEGERWVCAHPLVGEVTLAEMAPASRREVAGKLAEWWSTHRPERTEELARLYHDAGDGRRARPWIVKALQVATARSAVEVGGTYLAWLREMRRSEGTGAGAEGKREEAILEEGRLAFALDGLGNNQVLHDALLKLLSEEPSPAAKAELMADLAWATRDLSVQESERRAHEVLELAEARPGSVSRAQEALACVTLGLTASGRNAWREGIPVLTKAIELTEGEGPSPVRAAAFIQKAYCMIVTGQIEEARGLLDRGIEIAQACGATVRLSSALNTRAALHMREGDAKSAFHDFHEAHLYAQRAGTVLPSCFTLSSAAWVLTYSGDLKHAEELAKESLALALKFGVERGLTAAKMVLGRVYLNLGRFVEAKELAREAVEIALRIGREEHLAEGRILMAEAEGALSEDPHALTEVLDSLEKNAPALRDEEVEDQAELRLWMTRLALRVPDAPRARRYLNEAKGFLTGRPQARYLEGRGMALEAELLEREGHAEEAPRLREESERLMREAEASSPAGPDRGAPRVGPP